MSSLLAVYIFGFALLAQWKKKSNFRNIAQYLQIQ